MRVFFLLLMAPLTALHTAETPAMQPSMAESLPPEDKKLDPAWVASLTQRGGAMDSHICGSKKDDTLKYIGMPVGGIGCGSVYLGGDGRLWVWDVFNQPHVGVVPQRVPLTPELEAIYGAKWTLPPEAGANYVVPPTLEAFPNLFRQGFGLRIDGTFREFSAKDWAEVEFEGTWPVGIVQYRDSDSPVEVALRGYSPFIPLNLTDSSLPVTVMEFTLKNKSNRPVHADISGWLENASSVLTRKEVPTDLNTQRTSAGGMQLLTHSAVQRNGEKRSGGISARSDIVFADFEGADYGEWKVEGDAFAQAPVQKNKIPKNLGDVKMVGAGAVNSNASAPGSSPGEKDSAVGMLSSQLFTIERNTIRFLIGGGNHKGRTCLNLVIDGKVVASATGEKNHKMVGKSFDVSKMQGSIAQFQIVDAEKGGWGNIGVDHIVFSDGEPEGIFVFEEAGDYGTMSLGVLDSKAKAIDHEGVTGWESGVELAPGESKTVTFLVSWYFPNINPLSGFPKAKHEYVSRFSDSAGVAEYTAQNISKLRDHTAEWVRTWYDTTLPRWFSDRTLLTANTLQTANVYIFEDGQFWGWEGIGSSPGTCLHVWQYAQSVARLFPSLERNLREVTDYGYAQDESGAIRFRGKTNGMATDGQAGVVLRTYREHLMSPDDAFLRRVWPKTRLAMERLIQEDGNDDGILEGGQHNTLDSSWYGPVAWLSGLYQSALRAAEEMALVVGDDAFARKTRGIYERGKVNLVERLYNGEYFINIPDPSHPSAINSGSGCLIDQVLGQSWAFQVGLGRTLPQKEVRSALNAIWKYNFINDIAAYRKLNRAGRWYALPGERGMVICSFPLPDWNYEKACGVSNGKPHFAGYFNESMSGFEYQVAGHMIFEGTPDLVEKGLAITRSIHDRYAPSKRNPYNEIECSDHYSRAAASYGVFLAACGFEYNGPAEHIGFAPKITPEDFKAPFTTSEGWGSFSQKAAGGNLTAEIAVKWGKLRLRSMSLATDSQPASATVEVNGKTIPAVINHSNGTCTLTLPEDVILTAGQAIHLVLKTI